MFHQHPASEFETADRLPPPQMETINSSKNSCNNCFECNTFRYTTMNLPALVAIAKVTSQMFAESHCMATAQL